ncbi:MAG: ATP-binding protein [Thermodesulfobacteriota bacterium]|nr:ATP-binding protein [Thermodesulfobacteriota bacterium]
MLIKPSINMLVAESDIAVMQRCRERLLNDGHRVLTAESVEEALGIIQRHPAEVDIMFLSLDLPKEGGMTLIETLQRARPELLIMAMSEDCGEEAIEAMHAGAYDCIRKTFTAERFEIKMNRAIEAFRLRRQLGILTRQRQAALTKVSHDENLLAILQSFSDGLVVTDWQTNVVLFNDEAARLFGLTEEKAIGSPVSACLASDELLSLFVRAIKSDTSLVTLMAGEEPVVKVGEKTLRVHVDPVKNQAGTVIGAVSLFHDVTGVSAMDKLRDDFLSMVSHELKAPLSSLLMQISVVLDGLAGDLTPKQDDLLGKAKEKTKGMITLVNDILDYRRLQEGKSIQKIENLDMADVLERTADLMRLSAEEKGVEITFDVAEDIPAFNGDRGGVQAIFVNLISNAIKYTPKGGKIKVSLRKKGKDIRFKVVDTGIGIPPQDLNRVFEKFYRIKTDETKSISGSGLGLSIVKGIVEAHNGFVHLESEVGKGTTLVVSLPSEA